MPIGKGVVLIGMGERTTRQAVFQVAAQLFAHDAATRVIALPDAEEPRSDAPRHGLHASAIATSAPCTVRWRDQIRCYSARPGNKPAASRCVPTRAPSSTWSRRRSV